MKLYIYEQRRKDEVEESKFFKSIEEANTHAYENYRWLKNVEKLDDFCIITGMLEGDFPDDIDITDSDAIWECNGENYDINDCRGCVELDPQKMFSAIAKKHYDDIIDKMIEIDSELRPYQVDLYLYENGSLCTFENVGGNSWLNDNHCTIWSSKPYCGEYDGMAPDEIKDCMEENREFYENMLDDKIWELKEKEESYYVF